MLGYCSTRPPSFFVLCSLSALPVDEPMAPVAGVLTLAMAVILGNIIGGPILLGQAPAAAGGTSAVRLADRG